MSLRNSVSLVLGMSCLVSLIGAGRATATDVPADIGVYGEQPATFRDGVTPFPSSGSTWQFQIDVDDPITRLKFFAVPAMKNGLGRFTWRLASLGKYIVMANGQTGSVGGNATDLRVGIFNSETKQYCDLIIDPTLASAPAQIVTGNPGARKSRILLAPGTTPAIGGAAAFGYIAADLDAADPCTWPAVMASASQLNAGLAPADQICPEDVCSFDTVAMLGHEDVLGDPLGRDYVAVGDYFSGRNSVIRVDTSGITVVDTYQTQLFSTPGSGGACYRAAAARPPASDFRLPDTRPANDWRFLFSYDAYHLWLYPSTPPASCAAPYPYCPVDVAGDGIQGAPCPGSGTCAQSYCSTPFFGSYLSCTTTANCNFFNVNFGTCQNTCLPKSPLFTCKTSDGGGSHRQCIPTNTCQPAQGNTCPTGETCSSSAACMVFPSQEYRFDKTLNVITPTSAMFFDGGSGNSFNGPTPTGVLYGSDRWVWVQASGDAPGPDVGLYKTHASTDNCTVDGATVHVPTGEHCYYDLTNPSTTVVVPTDQLMRFERTPMLPYQAQTLEVGGATYFADTGSLQYAQAFAGTSVADTTYKTAFAYGLPYVPITDPSMSSALPAEPQRCNVSHLGCNVTADCPAGETCIAEAEDGVPLFGQFKFLEAGGSPKSMWVSSGYAPAVPVAQTDVFLERVPLALDLTDSLSAVRPSIAWGNDRLWLVAEHGGELKYRIRDDGVWSDWYSLAPNGITPVGGPAVIANASTVRIYAHDSAGRVWEKVLTSASTCAPGTCTWSSWVGLSKRVLTDMDVAATFAAGPKYYVAVRNQANQKIYATYWNGSAWVNWFAVGSQTTDAAPSMTYHPVDNRVWVAIRQPGPPPQFRYIRIVNSKPDNWNLVGGTPPVTWGYAPAIVSDGQAVRVIGLDVNFPQYAWQNANDGSGWSDWRRALSGSTGTYQPVATNVHGEIDLMTYWYPGGLREAMLP